ncbi:lysophospholipase [Microbulbifer sp. MLAF003]|uniref:alpha/beta hydrolase n=1 Tax=unclassified Microbulbifer TaxID=2619833 RepID=UPI0024ADBFEC|nr:alpha/beta hydrolase [Microbulbifer sp. MLAF003]WHI52449.1 lysophospholipase [Microbulbifer sp. MLAF003]
MEFVTRNVSLHYRRWWVEKALGVVVISHGLGEHSGRYTMLAQYLNRAGFSVYAPDHYGHGLSDGKRGHIDDFSLYCEDLHEFICLVKSGNPDTSVHLLGHSMGAVVACGSAIRYGFVDSVILSAPGFRGAKEPAGLELWLVMMLAKLFPKLVLSSRIDDKWLSRDVSIVEAYRNDELAHHGVSLRWFESFLQERAFLSANLERLLTPCLMLLPESDRLVDVELSREWFGRMGSTNKRLHCFPAAYHELFNEVEEGRLARDLLLGHLNSILPASNPVISG